MATVDGGPLHDDQIGDRAQHQAFLSDIEHGRRELGEQHYEKLSDAIRSVVVEAAIADLRDRVSRLRTLIQ